MTGYRDHLPRKHKQKFARGPGTTGKISISRRISKPCVISFRLSGSEAEGEIERFDTLVIAKLAICLQSLGYTGKAAAVLGA